MWPVVLLVTAGVVVVPIAAVYALRQWGVLPALWECVVFGIAFALVTVRAASAYWQRRRPGADLMFGELLLWGWLRRLRLEHQLRDASRLLEEATRRRRRRPGDRRAALLANVVDAFQALDAYTAGHSRRVARLATGLARSLGLPSEQVETISAAGAVHDVGKLRVPAEILNKPGSLTGGEYELVKRHAVEGAAIVAALGDAELTAIVRHHHERVDGNGYPDALAGEQIPIGARVIAVVDTYDAIIAARPYRPAEPHRQAMRVLIDDMGTQFDPEIVQAFVRSYSPRRAVLLWSGVGLAAVRAFGWARAAGPLGRPSPPMQMAANVGGLAALGVLAAVAGSLAHGARRHSRPPQVPAAIVGVVTAPTPSVPATVHHARRAAPHAAPAAPAPAPASAAATPAPVAAPAAPADPSIGSLTACRPVFARGGICTVRFAVSNARVCALSAMPALAGQLPAAVRCASGSGSRQLRLPANPGGSPRRWTLTLTATGAGRSTPARRQTTVTVLAPVRPPRITAFSADCATLPRSGGSCSIQWQAPDATACTLSANPPLPGQLPATVPCAIGQRDLRMPASASREPRSWRLTLTARGAPGSVPVRRHTTVVVAAQPPPPQPPPPPPPPPPAPPPAPAAIGSLTATCATLPAQGGPCTVQWTVRDARACTLAATPALAGQLPITVDCTSGAGQAELELPANPTRAAQTWTLTLTAAAAAGGTPASRQTTITVAARPAEPQVLSFGATCSAAPRVAPACSLQWSVRDAQTCTLVSTPALPGQLPSTVDCSSGSGQLQLELPGRVSGSPPQTWTLTLTVTGAFGTTPAVAQTSVTNLHARDVAALIVPRVSRPHLRPHRMTGATRSVHTLGSPPRAHASRARHGTPPPSYPAQRNPTASGRGARGLAGSSPTGSSSL